MTDERVSLTIDGAIATIRLERPDKLNALTPEMIADLAAAAERVDRDDGVRCAVLSAVGDRAFCVGADINRWAALTPLDMWRRCVDNKLN